MSAGAGVTGLVLCGGAGRRLGGIDKPLAQYRGAVLLERILARLRPQVDRVILSANRNLDRYRAYAPVVTDRNAGDRDADRLGPLAGIDAAAALLETPYLFVCPGDAPELPDDIVARLLEDLLAAAPANAAVVHDGYRQQSLHVLMRASALESLRAYLASGRRSAHGWLESVGAIEVNFSDRADAFRNLNTPDDFTPSAR